MWQGKSTLHATFHECFFGPFGLSRKSFLCEAQCEKDSTQETEEDRETDRYPAKSMLWSGL